MSIAKKLPLFTLLAAMAFSTAALTGCDDEGPLEQAGEAADEAVNDASRAIEDATD